MLVACKPSIYSVTAIAQNGLLYSPLVAATVIMVRLFGRNLNLGGHPGPVARAKTIDRNFRVVARGMLSRQETRIMACHLMISKHLVRCSGMSLDAEPPECRLPLANTISLTCLEIGM